MPAQEGALAAELLVSRYGARVASRRRKRNTWLLRLAIVARQEVDGQRGARDDG